MILFTNKNIESSRLLLFGGGGGRGNPHNPDPKELGSVAWPFLIFTFVGVSYYHLSFL